MIFLSNICFGYWLLVFCELEMILCRKSFDCIRNELVHFFPVLLLLSYELINCLDRSEFWHIAIASCDLPEPNGPEIITGRPDCMNNEPVNKWTVSYNE